MSKAAALSDQAKQVQKVYIEWCVKAAEIILDARLDPQDALEPAVHAQASASFNLKVPELWNVRGEAIARTEFFQVKTQRSFHIEVFLSEQSSASTSAPDEEDGQLLERWTFAFFPAHPEPNMPDRCNQTLVRKLSVTLRSLLSFTRILPAYSICRGPRPVPGKRRHRFRIEARAPPSKTPAQELITQDFASLQSSVGTLRLSVSHWKDLSSLQRGPERGFSNGCMSLGAQSEEGGFDVAEGYVAGATSSLPAASSPKTGTLESSTSLGRLGKIAEEPEANRPGGLLVLGPALKAADSGEHPAQSSTAASSAYGEAANFFTQRPRQRNGSDASEASSQASHASTSSRGHSMPDHCVVLGSTPPLATVLGAHIPPGLISLGPQHSSEGSASSSRSATPHSTPKLQPAPPPNMFEGGLGSQHGSPASSLQLGGGTGSPGGAVAPRPPSWGGPGGSGGPTSRPGAFEDISDLWMTNPAEWQGRRRHGSFGSRSRGSRGSGSPPGSGPGSRSLSPEDPSRASAAASGDYGDAKSGGRLFPVLPEPAGEICMFGMSDDEEDELQSEEEDCDEEDMERNVVASTLQESSAGAFVVSSGRGPLNIEQLGLAAALALEGAAAKASSSRRSSKDNGSGKGSPRSFSSPLIAQLNPFLSPPPLELPAAGLSTSGASASGSHRGAGAEGSADAGGDSAQVAEATHASPSASSALPSSGGALAASAEVDAVEEANAGAHHLLVEMGDLVCKLQQRRDLNLASHEVPTEDLLARLAHFRELANGPELRPHLNDTY